MDGGFKADKSKELFWELTVKVKFFQKQTLAGILVD